MKRWWKSCRIMSTLTLKCNQQSLHFKVKSPLSNLTIKPWTHFFLSSSPSPRMHRALACSSFYSCVFHRHFYCHRQTIKVCWTHACCPSAGCSSIKSIFLWKWVGGGGLKQIENPLRSVLFFYSELYKIRDPTAAHPEQVSTDLQTELIQYDGQCRARAREYSLFSQETRSPGKKLPYSSWEGRIPLVFTLANSQTACSWMSYKSGLTRNSMRHDRLACKENYMTCFYPCCLTERSFLGSISGSLPVWDTTRRVHFTVKHCKCIWCP